MLAAVSLHLCYKIGKSSSYEDLYYLHLFGSNCPQFCPQIAKYFGQVKQPTM